MAQNRFDIPIKETNDYDDDYDNDILDDSSDDDYDDDDRYAYSVSLHQNHEDRRGNSFSYSGSGHSNEVNEDNRKDHHNQLERKRRASIKSSYTELREAIPSLRDNKASRSVILQKAVDYLEELNKRNMDHVACVDHFSSENSALEAKCRDIENQVNLLLQQQRQNGYTPTRASSSRNYTNNNFTNTVNVRPSFRVRDEEDSSNDPIGSTNSTPNASSSTSTSRSLTSLSTTSTNNNEANVTDDKTSSELQCALGSMLPLICDNHRNPTNLDTGSNSSSAPDYYDDIEEIVTPPKKPRTE